MTTTQHIPVAASRRSRVHRARRIVGVILLIGGVVAIAWSLVVWRWNDPLTALYTRWEQHRLTAVHAEIVAEYRPRAPVADRVTPAIAAAEAAREARRLRAEAPSGAPIGRLVVPRLGLDMLMVNGTSTPVLKRGPGVDERTFMPGQGELVYIAGHRTTYLAPFSKIDALRVGDRVTLKMPYGTFDYAVTGHRIVDANDLSVLESHGKEVVALQACHPRFFASQRYIVWARPVSVTSVGGQRYRPTDN